MKVLDFLYYVSYCTVKEDRKANDRHRRAAWLVEGIIFFIVGFLTMIVIGVIDLRITSIFFWGLLTGGLMLVVLTLVKKYFFRHEYYKVLINNIQKFQTHKRKLYAFLGIIFLFFSFLLMILGGIGMSYLLSLH